MEVLFFHRKGEGEGTNTWCDGSTLYHDDCVNLISATKHTDYEENIVKVTSIDRLTGEKHTEIMACVEQSGDTMPDSTQSGILMESGKMYFIEIEDLEGNVVFEYTRAYSQTEGKPHKTVHGICDSSKCGVRVPSYDEFLEKTKQLSDATLNVSSKLTAKLGEVRGDIEDIEKTVNDATEDIDNIKAQVYGKYAVLSVPIPSMNDTVTLPYPDGFNHDDTVFLTCLLEENENGVRLRTRQPRRDNDITCDFDGIHITGIPTGTGKVENNLKFVFMRLGL